MSDDDDDSHTTLGTNDAPPTTMDNENVPQEDTQTTTTIIYGKQTADFADDIIVPDHTQHTTKRMNDQLFSQLGRLYNKNLLYGKPDDSSGDDDDDDEPVVVSQVKKPPPKPTTKVVREDLLARKRWPQFGTLVSSYPDYCIKLFQSLDECRAPECLKAFDGGNMRGNAWAKAQDVIFGGNRGTLSHLLPAVHKPTKLKSKVNDLWTWIETHQDKDDDMDPTLKQLALKQLKSYRDTMQKNKENIAAEKNVNAKLDSAMDTYERGQGAVPPGAVGDSCKGRIAHSTNTALGEPASFGYAHHRLSGNREALAQADAEVEALNKELFGNADASPEKRRGGGRPKGKSPKPTQANASAASNLREMNGVFATAIQEIIGSKKRPAEEDDINVSPATRQQKEKIKALKEQKQELMSSIRFKKEIGVEYDDSVLEFNQVCNGLQLALREDM